MWRMTASGKPGAGGFVSGPNRETPRRHPAITLTKRRALVDLGLDGRTVPAGANICIPLIAPSRHSTLYGELDEFSLDRWLGRHETKAPETLQFGGGPH